MLSRKHHEEESKAIPATWSTKIELILNSVYSKQLEKAGKQFEAFGQIFDDELLVIVSLVSLNQVELLPISCFLSMDADKTTEIDAASERLLDMAGIVFDSVFAASDWNDYEDLWTKETVNGLEFHYKISRENVALTLQANKLLANAGDSDLNSDLEVDDLNVDPGKHHKH